MKTFLKSLDTGELGKILWVNLSLRDQLPQNISFLEHVAGLFPKSAITVVTTLDFEPLYEPLAFVKNVISVNYEQALGDRDYQDRLLSIIREVGAEMALNLSPAREPLDDLFTVGSEALWRIAVMLGDSEKMPVDERELYTDLIDPDLLKEPPPLSEKSAISRQVQVSELLRVALLAAADHGGAGNAAYRLHRGLQQLGVHSTMLVLVKQRDDPMVKVLPANSGESRIIRASDQDSSLDAWKRASRRWKSNMTQYPNRPEGLEAFTDAISDVRLDLIEEVREADIINLHWIAALLDYNSALPALANRPVVWTLHDMNAFTGGCHYSAGCEKFLQSCGACPSLGSNEENDLSRTTWKTKCALYEGLNATVVAPSKWLADTARVSTLFSRFPVHCIPYGLQTDTFRPCSQESVRRDFNIAPTEDVVLFGAQRVSNLRKGFKFQIEAIKLLVNQPVKRSIVFATFGSEAPQISLPPPFRMHHFGLVEDDETIARIYCAADVFVIPSLEDNLPNTVLESLACGTPVVGFAVGGIPDMVEHKRTGFLAKPFDVEELAEGIRWTLSAKDSDPDIRQQCRMRVMADYQLNMQAEKYLELFRKLI